MSKMLGWALLLIALLVTLLFIGARMVSAMPGTTYAGKLPALTARESSLAAALQRDVERFAGEIGERNIRRVARLDEAAGFLAAALQETGYGVSRQSYDVAGTTCDNIEVEIRGSTKPDEIVIVGAHYDSVRGCPGANDNASGVAGVLALARAFAGKQTERTLRFVAFVNEEPPNFWTAEMGSYVYARRSRERGENIIGMISLETIGYYSDAKGSQKYPFPLNLLYPATGDFVGFVGNSASRGFVRRVVGLFRERAKFPSQGAVLPEFVREAGWSDHWSFWQFDYPALMVSDTALFRYPHYHTAHDTPDKLDYDRMARVITGLEAVIRELTKVQPQRR